MNNLLNKLTRVGWLELLLAFYPILSGYAYGALRLDLLVLLLLDIAAFVKTRKVYLFRPLLYLAAFVVLHEFVLFFFLEDMPVYHVNNLLSIVIFFSSVFIIVPALDFKKLQIAIGSVAVISVIGIVYHFFMLQTGREVHPIKLPLLPDLSSSARLFEEGNRPTSFYWEPAAFVTFMMIPLWLSLYKQKFVWAIMITVSMFLSTSSTGIFLSMLMLCIYAFSQKIRWRYKLGMLLVSVGLVYFLLTSNLFEAGVSKIENIDIETNSRLMNGPMLVAGMPLSHLLFGMPSSNVNDYYYLSGALKVHLIPTRAGTIFVSTFWLVWAKFGIIGLFLLVNFYWMIIKRCKALRPYSIVLVIALFSQGFMFSSIFVFQSILMLTFMRYSKSER